jgi:spore photoproduct lyase
MSSGIKSDFHPEQIYIESSVKDLPKTSEILERFPDAQVEVIENRSEIKFPQNHTLAKKRLFLARFKGQAVKTCQGMGDYVCCQYHTISLISNCHLECTYCILQDYLKNNPIITFYVNTDEIFDEVAKKAKAHSQRLLRVGTGELSDTLALDHITGFSKDYINFANEHPNVLMELKTKTDNIGNLLKLKHRRNVIASWSINPDSYIRKEEFKCATLSERFDAARACADAGYPIAFHMDPLIFDDNWQEEYTKIIDEMAKRFESKEIAWISMGSLRFTKSLKKISQERFPNSKIMSSELYPSADGKMRYFRPLREEMYKFIKDQLKEKLRKVPHYLCMETQTVWDNVFENVPQHNGELEAQLIQNF